MTKNGTPAKTRLFSQPLRQNAKAIRPLYAVILASGCWEAAALLMGTSTGRTQDHFGEAFVLASLAFQLFAVIGSIVYRHFEVALLSLAAAVLITYSGYKYTFGWICFPWYPVLWVEQAFGLAAAEYLQSHLAALWLCLQAPFILLALRRCRWPRRVKIGTAALAGVGIVCFFVGITRQANHEAAAALHVSGDYLASVYSKSDRAAMQHLDHQRLVVTGVAFGADEGLFGGNSAYKIEPQIECDELVGGDTLADGQIVSVLGTCEGKDSYGMIHLADCRVIR